MPDQGPSTSKPLWQRALSVTGYVVVCLLALGLGTISGWVNSSRVLRAGGGLLGALLPPDKPQALFGKNELTLLMLGCDEDRVTGGASITNNQARSDMMLLAKLNFDTGEVTGVSIPRDTLVNVPSYDRLRHKINAFHVYGGNKLAATAVETLLPGVHIDRVVTLNFEGFREMVDLVGGVPMQIDKNMDYVDHAGHLAIHLKKGFMNLDGETAEGFVRFRHSDSDYAREDRQHRFMLAFKEALSKNARMLPKVIDATAKMLADGLNDREVNSLGHFINGMDKSKIRFGQVPVIDDGSEVRPNNLAIPSTLRSYGFDVAGGRTVRHA
jgi:LCP family protein required for cell wall assembly